MATNVTETITTAMDICAEPQAVAEAPSIMSAGEHVSTAMDICPKPHAGSDASSATFSGEKPSSIFNFFGLPRELRDMIYEQPELVKHQRLPIKKDEDLLTKVQAPLTALLLVSQDFRREYCMSSANVKIFAMRDRASFQGMLTEPTPKDFASIWNMELCVENTSLEPARGELAMHTDYIAKWAPPRQNLKIVNVKLYLLDTLVGPTSNHETLKRSIAIFQSIDKLKLLEIYTIKKIWRYTLVKEQRMLLTRWKQGDDLQINLEGGTKCVPEMDFGWEGSSHKELRRKPAEGEEESDSESESEDADGEGENDNGEGEGEGEAGGEGGGEGAGEGEGNDDAPTGVDAMEGGSDRGDVECHKDSVD